MPDLLKTQPDLDEEIPLEDMPPEERHRVLRAALAAGVLFLWDTTRKRYISTETERMVSQQTVARWVKDIGSTAKDDGVVRLSSGAGQGWQRTNGPG